MLTTERSDPPDKKKHNLYNTDQVGGHSDFCCNQNDQLTTYPSN